MGQAFLAALFAPAVLGWLLAGAELIVRRRLQRRRIAAWDTDWQATEPRWTSRH